MTLEEQKEAALAFVRKLARFQGMLTDEEVNGGDLVETVDEFLEESGLLTEARVEFLQEKSYTVDSGEDGHTVSGPGCSLRVVLNDDLARFIASVVDAFEGEDSDDEPADK